MKDPLDQLSGVNQSPSSRVPVIIYIILSLTIIGLIIGLIVVSSSKNKEVEDKIIYQDRKVPKYVSIAVPIDNINENYFGEIRRGLNYSQEGIVKNTFGASGSNYIEDVGDIHDDKDYNDIGRNVYDLYIPEKALLNKNGANGINGIFLFIHGGAWIQGSRSEMESYFINYGQLGFITANMEYTLLINNSKDTNIFRMIDEISACIGDIKERLKAEGFDENFLQIAIFGYSAGAHLTLLYSYLIKDSPIKIKFTVNLCGPISMHRHLNLALKVVNDTLPSLEKSVIEQAFKDGKLKNTEAPDSVIPLLYNQFLGVKYQYSEIEEMLMLNGSEYVINYTNVKFQDLQNRTNYAFPLYIEDKNKVPVLCLYSGNDEVVGIMAYGYLEEKAKKDGKTIELIYSKYTFHSYFKFDMEDSINCLRTLNIKILEFADRYFKKD